MSPESAILIPQTLAGTWHGSIDLANWATPDLEPQIYGPWTFSQKIGAFKNVWGGNFVKKLFLKSELLGLEQ